MLFFLPRYGIFIARAILFLEFLCLLVVIYRRESLKSLYQSVPDGLGFRSSNDTNIGKYFVVPPIEHPSRL